MREVTNEMLMSVKMHQPSYHKLAKMRRGRKRDILGQHSRERELQKKYSVVDIVKNNPLSIYAVM